MVDDVVSPFGYKRGEGIDAGFGEHEWICNRDRARTDPIFESLNPVDGKITGAGNLFDSFHFKCLQCTILYSCFHFGLNCLFVFILLFFIYAAAKTELIKSKLPNSVLSKIWKLADYNADGKINYKLFSKIH